MADEILKLVFKQSLYGIRVINVFHYQVTTPPSGGSGIENGLNQAFADHVVPSYQAALSSSWLANCLETSLIGPGGNTPRIKVFAENTDGDRAATALPPNSVCSWSEYTQILNKTGRGRHFISGLLLADEDDNALNDTAFGLFTTLATASSTAITDNEGGVYGRILYSGAPPAAHPLFKIIAHSSVKKLRGRTQKVC